MVIEKELSQIAWNVPESVYRADPALSYSTLATYERSGFDGLDHLFDKKESPALLLGSVLDCLLTGGWEEFNSLYTVVDFNLTESGINICQQLFDMHLPYNSFEEIPEQVVSDAAKLAEFWKADKWNKVRYREVLKTGNIDVYYNAHINSDKTIIDSQTYNDALAMVKALKESPATSGCFAENDEMSPIRRYYQLKFKFSHNNVNYRSMADLIIVDYEDKIVYPYDLKSSGKPEWHFEDSFLQWSYMIQSRLYWRNIRANMDADPYFKDFKLADYKFIVANKFTLTPLIWEFPLTQSYGTLVDEKGNEYRDPFVIGEELQGYLNLRPLVPNGIDKDGMNIINCLKLKE